MIPGMHLGRHRHTQTHSKGCHQGFHTPSHKHMPSIPAPSRYHSSSQDQYIGFISPSLSRESRGPNLNENRARGWGAAPWVSRNTNHASLGMGPSPGTPPEPGQDVLCPRPMGRSQGSTREGEGPPRRLRGPAPAGRQTHIHVHIHLLRPAASRLPATGPQRRPLPGCPQHRSGQGHENSGVL